MGSGRANLLVQGDNLDVLRDLAATFAGEVRCSYIDPPYNNNERYNHYDDRLSQDEWLESLAPRLEAIWELLRDDGSLWISIDDGNLHYLKVLMDGLVGRSRFLTTIVWEHRTTRENRRVFSNNHEYILVYAKEPMTFGRERNPIPTPVDVIARYKNPDGDPRGPWQSVSANVQDGHATPSQFYPLVAPNGTVHHPPKGRCWVYTQKRMDEEISAGNVWFGKNGDGVPRLKAASSRCAGGCHARDALDSG